MACRGSPSSASESVVPHLAIPVSCLIVNWMVNSHPPALNDIFAALSDPTRRAILAHLASGPAATTDLAKPFPMSLPAVLKHLRVLEAAGLVQGERHGRERRYRLTAGPLRDARSWLDTYRAFWDSQLDALAQFMEESNQ